ncbi:MBL fold metallo-hydrolase [Pseudomonas sp. NPDC077649]|uniref:MBL fold metallo-hydrolase n=1 Tax=Pseudomonas sp. NPDC077649 TaxID=3364423 RepID=UPI0037C70422
MQQIRDDLWETATETPMPGLTTHAYLLTREAGNLLFFNTSLQQEIERMGELGGVAYQLLSHRDELGDSLLQIRQRFGTRLGGHRREQAEFARFVTPDILFDDRETLLGNIDVIPTPGHSPGSTCFLVHSPTGQRYLFTGDTLYRSADGSWKAGFIAGHNSPADRQTMATSITGLRELEPDLVIGSAFAGSNGYQEMGQGEWQAHVDDALERLMR